MFSRFTTISARDWQTDRQTDGLTEELRMRPRDKNRKTGLAYYTGYDVMYNEILSSLYGGLFLPMLPNDSPLNHSTIPQFTPLFPKSLHSPSIHSTLPWITPLSTKSLHSPPIHSTTEIEISHRKWKFQNKVSFSTAKSRIMFWKYRFRRKR